MSQNPGCDEVLSDVLAELRAIRQTLEAIAARLPAAQPPPTEKQLTMLRTWRANFPRTDRV